MPVFTQRMNNLVGGVSQQTPELRLANQCQEQVNCWNDAVTGMRKRPNTTTLCELPLLSEPTDITFHTHIINDRQRYLVAASADGVQVYDTYRKEECVVTSTGDAYLAGNGQHKMMTIGDDVFVLNTDRPTAMKEYTAPPTPPTNDSKVTFKWSFKQASGMGRDGYIIHVGGVTYNKFGHYYTYITHGGHKNEDVYRHDAWRTPAEDARRLYNALVAQYPTETFKLSGESVTWEGLQSVGIKVSTTQPQWLNIDSTRTDVFVSRDDGGIVYIAQPDYEVIYTIDVEVDGTKYTYSHTTPSSTSSGARRAVATSKILGELGALINNDTANKLTASIYKDNCLLVYPSLVDTVEEWSLSCDDDLDGGAIIGFRSTLRREADLPPDAPEDYYVEIVPNNAADSYHLKYSKSETGDGYWAETVKRGISNEIDENSMPHILRLQYDEVNDKAAFSFEPYEWSPRTVGDIETAPEPSFIGRSVTAMSLLRGRLVLTSGNDIVMSEVNNDGNFWPTTILTTVDSDPVDLSLDSPEALTIEAITSDNEVLVLWDNNIQMGLQHDGQSWIANEVSAYNVDAYTAPVRVGSNIYYSGYETGRSQIGAYFRAREQLYESVDVTSHVPTYLNLRVRYITGNSVDSYVAMCSADGGEAFVYNYRKQGQDLVQSSWSKWTVGDGVYYMEDTNGELQLVVKRPDGKYYLESLDFQSQLKVMMDGLTVHDSRPTPTDGKKVVRYNGKWYMGWNYTQTYEFSPIYYRYNSETQTDATLMLRRMELDYEDTVGFDFSVKNHNNVKTKSLEMIKGLPALLNGDVEHKRGKFSMLARGNSENLTLSLSNKEPYNCTIVAAKWTGSYHKRTR